MKKKDEEFQVQRNGEASSSRRRERGKEEILWIQSPSFLCMYQKKWKRRRVCEKEERKHEKMMRKGRKEEKDNVLKEKKDLISEGKHRKQKRQLPSLLSLSSEKKRKMKGV